MSANFTPTQSAIKDLKPFRFWCQKVLPTVYDDSLSYYELLTKVVNYLNDTIDNVEALNDNVQNIYDAYILLQNYVNDYFDNNLPQLVSDKLDEMAEDGTLTALIMAYIDPYFEAKSAEIEEAFDAQNDRINEAISDQNAALSAQTNSINELTSRMDAFINQHSGLTGETLLYDASGTPAYTTGSYLALSDALANYKYLRFVWKHRGEICVQDFEINASASPAQNYNLRDTISAPPVQSGGSSTWEMCNITVINGTSGSTNRLQIGSATVVDNTGYNDGPVDGNMNTGILKVIGVKNVSDTEVVDARVGADGTTYATLEERLNAEYNALKDATGSLTVYNPTDFGLDLENDRYGDNISIPISKYPCSTFTNSTIIILSPDYSIPYTRTFRIGNSGTWLYIDNNSSTGTILVGNVYYRYIKYNITWNTEYTPQTIPSTAYWRMFIPYLKSQHPEVRNADVKILADYSLEDITPKLIAELYDLPQGIELLNGKKWLALGDSYTNNLCGGQGAWTNLATKIGMTLSNYGVANSTIRVSTGDGDYAYRPMSERVDTLISEHTEDADEIGLITFMGGTNDGYSSAKIGTLESTALTTIYGGCHHIFNSLINAFPNALVLVILQPVSGNGTATAGGFDGYQNSIYASQLKQRAVKETAEFYGLPICDCCFDWYTTANPSDLVAIWQSDKLHLTAKGNNDLTNKMTNIIDNALTIE